MKQLQKQLQSAVKTLTTLATKIEAISKKLEGTEKAKPAPAKKSPKKQTKKAAPKKAIKKSEPKKPTVPTASDTILKFVSRSEKGLDTAALVKKTGFNTKKVQNTVFRLRKLGKIKSAAKGIYVKA
jgi:hypothetical protein